MSKKARLIIGIILIVLGVISLMGLYLQTGMNLWTAFGVGLGASIFTIGLPCLGTFLIWGYKKKEKKEKVLNNEKPIEESKNNPKIENKILVIEIVSSIVIFGIIFGFILSHSF